MECQDILETKAEISKSSIYPKTIYFVVKGYLDIYNISATGKVSIQDVISKHKSDLVQITVNSEEELIAEINKLTNKYDNFIKSLKE